MSGGSESPHRSRPGSLAAVWRWRSRTGSAATSAPGRRCVLDGLLLGVAQAVALAPGVSRSGAARTVARARGFHPQDADRPGQGRGIARHGRCSAVESARAAGVEGASCERWRPERWPRGSRLPRAGALKARSLLPYAAYRAALAGVTFRRRATIRRDDRLLRRSRSGHRRGRPRDRSARGALGRARLGRPSRSRLRSGHYASVLEIAPGLGLALSTDGVGSKLMIAEQAGKLATVGIDCVAMNVNDIVCVGAEPIAMLDYIAVHARTPPRSSRWGSAWRAAPSSRESRSPAASSPSCPSKSTDSSFRARRSGPWRSTLS